VSLARLVASGFGSGFAPKAPGTAGSLAALLIGAGLMLLPPLLLPLAALLASLGGLWAIGAARVDGDPGWVVIDEFAGMWITMLGLARVTPMGLIAAFLVFRLLDIAKPGPVGWADRQKGAAGIMADDIIAGAIGAGILWAVRSRFPGVFEGGMR
jgi:phosphatidylglycerophosphatase A